MHCLGIEFGVLFSEGLSCSEKEEKEFVTAEEERKFWEMNLLGTSSAKSLLYTVYFYNGKIFGLMLRSRRELSRITRVNRSARVNN